MAKSKTRETLITTIINQAEIKVDVLSVGRYKDDNTPIIPNVVRLRFWRQRHTAEGAVIPVTHYIDVGVGRIDAFIDSLRLIQRRANQAIEEKQRRDDMIRQALNRNQAA